MMDKDFLKIVITGPESSGKTTLAEALGTFFNEPVVAEHAREYLEENGLEYNYTDLLKIAEKQKKNEKAILQKAHKYLICDTDLLTLLIWSEDKFNEINKQWKNDLAENKADLYLLMSPEIAWEKDPQREDGNRRNHLFDIYLSQLKRLNLHYKIITGSPSNRLRKSVDAIRGLEI